MEVDIRGLVKEDWSSVAEIYMQGINSGNATFETEETVWDQWDEGHLQTCRLVAILYDKIIGWAALSPVSSRSAYSGIAEVSIYVSDQFTGHGVGTKLLETLISESEKVGIWTLQASIFPENAASLKMHGNAGFRRVGFRERIGMLSGRWRDTILVERRSKTAGIQ
jgi:L-amino acid N-acyltransferase YncA